jgi:hypothetical protein
VTPLKTLRAAHRVLSGTAQATHEAVEGRSDPRQAIAAALRGMQRAGKRSDWYEALLYGSIDRCRGDLGRAVALADAAFKKQPTQPA